MANLGLFAVALIVAHVLPAMSQTCSAGVEVPATLVHWASFPSETYAYPPYDAESLRVAGKFAAGRRVEALGSQDYSCSDAPGTTPPAHCTCSDKALPAKAQVVQGLSGIRTIRDASGKPTGDFTVISDNGFGSRKTSPDAALMFHYVRPAWDNKTVAVSKTVFLSDPAKKLPFLIANEGTTKRYLTGADLDTESIQPVGSSVWIGDEFGPYLLEFNMSSGELLAFYDIPLDPSKNATGTNLVKSPDHDSLVIPDTAVPPAAQTGGNLKRSKGFEGMAVSSGPDGAYLWPMLEGAVVNNGSFETACDGRDYLRIYKFNLRTRTFEPVLFKYVLEKQGNAIGDFNVLCGTKAMIIERDNGQGDSAKNCTSASQCAAGKPTAGLAGCFPSPAAFKRVYLVDLAADDKGFVKKDKYIDLLNIQDPKGVSPFTSSGVFKFPFQTIEDVDAFDYATQTIVLANDNNYPFSVGRTLGKADNNEFMVLNVPEFFAGSCPQPAYSGIPSFV